MMSQIRAERLSMASSRLYFKILFRWELTMPVIEGPYSLCSATTNTHKKCPNEILPYPALLKGRRRLLEEDESTFPWLISSLSSRSDIPPILLTCKATFFTLPAPLQKETDTYKTAPG